MQLERAGEGEEQAHDEQRGGEYGGGGYKGGARYAVLEVVTPDPAVCRMVLG